MGIFLFGFFPIFRCNVAASDIMGIDVPMEVFLSTQISGEVEILVLGTLCMLSFVTSHM